jgi:hypothetical protein
MFAGNDSPWVTNYVEDIEIRIMIQNAMHIENISRLLAKVNVQSGGWRFKQGLLMIAFFVTAKAGTHQFHQ